MNCLTKTTPFNPLALGAALLLTSTCLLAGRAIEERRDVNPDALVIVKNVKGEIRIDAWDQSAVEITGDLGAGSRELAITGNQSRLTIEVEVPRNARNVEETVLYLQVPTGVSLEVESVSAEVDIRGMRSQRIRANAVSGEITVDAHTQELELTVVSGDIEFSGHASSADLSSVSGDIDVRDIVGEIAVSTVSGEVLLRARELEDARFESVSGDFEIDATLAADAMMSIESLSGDVDLSLPNGESYQCEAETYSGRIRSDRGSVQESKHGQHKRLSFTSEGGDGRVRIESFSGDIRITSSNRDE